MTFDDQPQQNTGSIGRRLVILDTDPALGVPRRDLDDGLALLMLLAAPEVDLHGITITFGNVKQTVAVASAHDLLARVGADIPVFEGAHSRHDSGKPTEAAKYLVDTVRAHPGEISLLAIGPLTNIATAMELDPGFASRLRELVIMGGGLNFGLLAWFGEFNFKCDATSAARVLADPIPKTLVTQDVISHAVFRQAQLEQLEAGTGPIAHYLAGEIAPWLNLNKKIFRKAQGFYPWDPVSVAYLTNPELFDANPYRLEVTKRGPRAGRISRAERLPSFEPCEGKTPVNLPLQLDADAFMQWLMEGLLSFDAPEATRTGEAGRSS